MKFRLTTPNENYPILRYVSEQGKCECGMYPVIYGKRISFGEIDKIFYAKGGYCAGNDILGAANIMIFVLRILYHFDESLPLGKIESQFPDWSQRPIPLRDPKCLQALKFLAELSYPEPLDDLLLPPIPPESQMYSL